MKRAQVIKLWRSLDGSTSQKEVISAFKNKKGYDSEATLKRYAQIYDGFKQKMASQELVSKTTWSMKFIEKLRIWWIEEFAESSYLPSDLKIGVTVKGIKTAGYYDRLLGGKLEGDKELTLEVVLYPSQPTTIDILNLDIWGNKIEAEVRESDLSGYQWKVKKFAPVTITATQTCNLFFHVPKELAKDTQDARIYAFANLRECHSEPFSISFSSDF
jgi:hypothetical protein